MIRFAPRAALLAPLTLAAGCARLFPDVDVGSAPTAMPPATVMPPAPGQS